MKTLIIIAVSLVMLILVAVLTLPHFKHSSGPDIHKASTADVRAMSDAKVRKVFTGDWVPQGSTWGGLTLHSSGRFTKRLGSVATSDAKQWLYEGTWAVKDMFLTLTITNAVTRNTTDSEPVGSIDQFMIVKVDQSQLVLQKEGVKTYFSR
ncbi:MAG: hypothetical protein P4N59_02975 [Negativicutes bacterium]|nr:hypothetical protein [Formivibrio sp.]MDR3560394.1 hypothetical protein [Negativicutes bacterium]